MANLVTYAKQKWEDAKTAITAARLNNMEQGINDCATQINALGDSVSRTMGNHGKSDLDDVVTPGVYTVRSSVKHIPNGASVYAVLFVIVAESGVCSQFYVPNGGTSLYWCTSWSGDFLEWRECKGSAQSIASDPSIPDGELS